MDVEQALRELQDLKRIIQTSIVAFEDRTGMTITDLDITHDQTVSGKIRTISVAPVASLVA